MKKMFSKENNAIGIASSVICLIIAFLADVLSNEYDRWKYWIIAFVIIVVGSLVLMMMNYLILANKTLVFKLKEIEIDNLICTNIEFILEIKKTNVAKDTKKYYALGLLDNIERLVVLLLKRDGTTKTKSQMECFNQQVSFFDKPEHLYLLEEIDKDRLEVIKRNIESIMQS